MKGKRLSASFLGLHAPSFSRLSVSIVIVRLMVLLLLVPDVLASIIFLSHVRCGVRNPKAKTQNLKVSKRTCGVRKPKP